MTGWWLASYLALWAVVLGTVVLLLVVLRQLGLIYARTKGAGGVRLDDGPEVGAVISPFYEVDEVTGEGFTFPERGSDLSVVLTASAHCSLCKEALVGIPSLARAGDARFLILSDGEQAGNEALRDLVKGNARFVTSAKRQHALAVDTIPYGIVVNGSGIVLDKGVVNHLDDLEELLERAAVQPARAAVATPA
jgi:methylamine dehydrogenase accessory protein MauD